MYDTLKYRRQREEMVEKQLKVRGITDTNVLGAMLNVPRHFFVSEALMDQAYGDFPLPIGEQQTISQPFIVAEMSQALQLSKDDRVLELGTGSGYQAAVCAELARTVYTIEIVEPLAQSAAKLLRRLGYQQVHVKAGDGFHGWPERAP